MVHRDTQTKRQWLFLFRRAELILHIRIECVTEQVSSFPISRRWDAFFLELSHPSCGRALRISVAARTAHIHPVPLENPHIEQPYAYMHTEVIQGNIKETF